MAAHDKPPADGPARSYLLFFRYVQRGPYTEGEPERRARASDMVHRLGGTCEIFRFPNAWNDFNLVSIVRGLSRPQVMELAEAIDSWGAVQTTVVEIAEIAQGLRR